MKDSSHGSPAAQNPFCPTGSGIKVLAEIDNKGLTIKDAAVYIKNSRGVTYKYNTLWKILRKKYQVKYGKPYKVNSKRPMMRKQF